MTDFLSELRDDFDAIVEQGRILGAIQERQAIADWVQSHISWMPGGPEWATSLLKFLAERTEPTDEPPTEPLDERCSLWFITDGQRAQCYMRAGHDGQHASFEEFEAWKQIKRDLTWKPIADLSPLEQWNEDGNR